MLARCRGSKAKQKDGSNNKAMSNQPTAISRAPDGAIVIHWDDQAETIWTAGQLRRVCPCATCREKKKTESKPATKPTMLPVISAAEAMPIRVDAMRPMGNYAYNISFSDGHNSGLFTLAMLRDGYEAVVAD